MPEQAEIMEWRGCEVVDQDGDKVGKLDEIYLDRETGKPEWAIVNTGLFGRKSSFVPLRDALREGDMIRVPYESDQIKEAPSVDPDGEISAEEEQRVYAHYGLEYSQARSGSGLPEGGNGDARQSAAGGGTSGDGGDVESGQQAGDAVSAEQAGDAQSPTQGTATQSATGSAGSGAGVRLRRMIREDVRITGEGDSGEGGEVIERRTVQEERLSPESGDEN